MHTYMFLSVLLDQIYIILCYLISRTSNFSTLWALTYILGLNHLSFILINPLPYLLLLDKFISIIESKLLRRIINDKLTFEESTSPWLPLFVILCVFTYLFYSFTLTKTVFRGDIQSKK